MRFQPIYDIAEICARKNVLDAVLCPGSRCAPLTLAFTRHQRIASKTFSDERSAGYIALGMGQQKRSAVAVVCTSGTAVYNLAPAVAEAFFSETPLIIMTADRPSEWIGQHDGQTIFQSGIFGKHVKKSFVLPQDYDHADSHWEINRIVNEAINLSLQQPRGPVHINAPFREPLYPGHDESTGYSPHVRVINQIENRLAPDEAQKAFIQGAWASYDKVLVVAGQYPAEAGVSEALGLYMSNHSAVLLGDITSNQQQLESCLKHTDLLLGQASDTLKKALQPGLLITFGQSLISKNLKLFLRRFPPMHHWHIQPGGTAADTYKHTTAVFQASPESFFRFLSSLEKAPGNDSYRNQWHSAEQKVSALLGNFFDDEEFSELEVVRDVLARLPEDCNLHLANSMSVRYANFIGLTAAHKGVRVFANRGTSGIDGCTSTSVGHYLACGEPTFLITGDLAFFYDRNAFWHNYPVAGLRVVLLNNHGGLIFNMIDGPASMPEAAEYFITRQRLDARSLCREFGFTHLAPRDRTEFGEMLKDFSDPGGKTKILEIESDLSANRAIFDRLKQKIKKVL